MAVGEFIGNGNPDGSSFGSGIAELISFYGVTPVAQLTAAAQAAASATASTTTSPWGFSTSTQADAIVTLVNRLRADLVSLGLIKGS